MTHIEPVIFMVLLGWVWILTLCIFIDIRDIRDRLAKLERHVHSSDELLGKTNGPQEP